jgi:tRNA threonylcarbamoyladenosine biosynthesis protein TsaE
MAPPDPTRLPLVSLRLHTRSTEETRSLAAALAPVAEPGDRLALVGPLGAGKTQFAKGFAIGLGIVEVVNSPSFTLMAEYEGRLPLFHQDLYRLADAGEVLAGGLLDERQDDGVTLSEWADRLDEGLDPSRLTVAIEPTGPDSREIEIRGHGAVAKRYLAAARRWREVAA